MPPRFAALPPWADGKVPVGEDGVVPPENRRSTTRNPEPKTLNPWHREKRLAHRGLLLLAMQDPHSNRANGRNSRGVCEGRSLEAVVKTLVGEISRGGVRMWLKRNGWADRIGAHGPDAQRYAVRLYRRMYWEEHGRGDMEALAPLISVPITSAGERQLEVGTDVQVRAAQLLQTIFNGGELGPEAFAPDETPDPVKEAWEARRTRAREQNKALRKTALQGIRALQASIRMAVDAEFREDPANAHIVPVRMKVGDFPRLVKVLRELDEEEARLLGLQTATGGGAVPDTARVAIAKELGQPVLPAILEDLAEATTICRQLIAREPLELSELQLQQTEDATEVQDVADQA